MFAWNIATPNIQRLDPPELVQLPPLVHLVHCFCRPNDLKSFSTRPRPLMEQGQRTTLDPIRAGPVGQPFVMLDAHKIRAREGAASFHIPC